MPARLTRQWLAEVIRERRETIGLTQEAAAERANVSTRYWRSLEAGRPAVALEVVERVLVGLDWSWRDLVDALEPEPVEHGTPLDVRRLLDQAWRRATPREREIVRGALRLLAGGKHVKGR